MEAEHQNRLLALLEKIPHGVPAGWEKETFAVGGLMYIGFSNLQTEKLVVVTSQGQSVINCQTWEKVYELVPIAGLGGGGLRKFSRLGDGLDRAAPYWPKEQIIFMPQYASWYQSPEACTIIFDDYGPKAFGFSRCGNYMAVATSSEVDIFKRTGE